MISHDIDPGTHRRELASAIRQVNAAHSAAGSPDLPEMGRFWFALQSDLETARAKSDDAACRQAIERYRFASIAAIEEAGA